MAFWIKNIRKIILLLSGLVSLYIYWHYADAIQSPDLRNIRITESYGLAALLLIYISLLASPLYAVFPNLPLRAIYIKARRATGVSAFYFAWLHFYFGFFKLLGGFNGFKFLDSRYLLAITLSFIALLILTTMAATSFDLAVRKLGRYWKWLHRFVYLAGVLIIIHFLLLGGSYADLSGTIPEITFGALLFLLILETVRLDQILTKKFPGKKIWHLITIVILAALAIISYIYLGPNNNLSFNIHAQHLKALRNSGK